MVGDEILLIIMFLLIRIIGYISQKKRCENLFMFRTIKTSSGGETLLITLIKGPP